MFAERAAGVEGRDDEAAAGPLEGVELLSTGFLRTTIGGVGGATFGLSFSAVCAFPPLGLFRPLFEPFGCPDLGACWLIKGGVASPFDASASTFALRCAFPGVSPRSRCKILAAAAMLPRSRAMTRGFFGGSVGVFAGWDCELLAVCLAASLFKIRTASRLTFSIFSFFVSLEFFFGDSSVVSFVLDLPADDDCSLRLLLLPFEDPESLVLLAFLSFRYCTSGVVVTFSAFAVSVSSSLIGAGFARLSRKSINSGSRSIVPCLASVRRLPLGIRPYGAYSTVGGPSKQELVYVLAASSKESWRTWFDNAIRCDSLVRWRYALEGRETLAGLYG